MLNMETLLKLRELEDKIKVYRILSKAKIDEEYKKAARGDVRHLEYSYKKVLANMSDEDKLNLLQLSLQCNIKLNYLFKLSPGDEEKAQIKDAEKWFNEPLPWQDELMEFIEKEEKKSRRN